MILTDGKILKVSPGESRKNNIGQGESMETFTWGSRSRKVILGVAFERTIFDSMTVPSSRRTPHVLFPSTRTCLTG